MMNRLDKMKMRLQKVEVNKITVKMHTLYLDMVALEAMDEVLMSQQQQLDWMKMEMRL